MKKLVAASFAILISVSSLFAQEKGVDKQTERVRDNGTERTPAINGNKTDIGVGRGMDFGKGKTPRVAMLDNPYRFTGRRDAIIKAVEQTMQDKKLVLDDAASRSSEGIIVSQPYRFIKGAVVSESELSHYANVPTTATRGWTQGRYTLTVEVQAIDGSSSKVSVNAKIEGRTDGATGAEWVTLSSLGVVEDEFLAALVEQLTGAPAPGRAPSTNP